MEVNCETLPQSVAEQPLDSISSMCENIIKNTKELSNDDLIIQLCNIIKEQQAQINKLMSKIKEQQTQITENKNEIIALRHDLEDYDIL